MGEELHDHGGEAVRRPALKRVGRHHWDRIAGRPGGAIFHGEIALCKKRATLNLVAAAAPAGPPLVLLKTDLFEEAYGRDALMGELAGLYGFCAGIDYSDVTAGRAARRFPECRVLAADVGRLPFPDASFDVVVSNSTLDHLPPELLPGALREIARVLKPGGRLALTLDSGHNVGHLISNALRRRAGMVYAHRCYTLGEVRRHVAAGGLEVVSEGALFHVPPGFNFLAKTARRLAGPVVDAWVRRAVVVFESFGRRAGGLRTGRFIAIAARKTD